MRSSGAASGEPDDWPGLAAFVVTTLVFAVLVGVPISAARFPFDVFREWTLDRAYDLERVPFGAWFGGYLRGVLVQAGARERRDAGDSLRVAGRARRGGSWRRWRSGVATSRGLTRRR